MIIQIKPSLRVIKAGDVELSSKVATYMEIPEKIETGIFGAPTVIPVRLGTFDHKLAEDVALTFTSEELKEWGEDENLITIILEKLEVQRAEEPKAEVLEELDK